MPNENFPHSDSPEARSTPTAVRYKRPCPLCGSRGAEKITEISYLIFDGCALENPIAMLFCPHCGMVYNEVKNPASLARYYSAQAPYGAEMGSGSGGLDELERRRYQASLDVMAGHLSGRDELVVDVGCARGGLLEFMREEGFTNLAGVDPAQACVDLLRGRNFAAAVGGAENIPAADGRAGLIYSSNVFEHLYDMAGAVKEAGRALKAGGLFYIEVPESKEYAECHLKHMQWLLPEHINFIGREHLIQLLESGGFSVLESGYGNIHRGRGRVQPSAYVLGRKENRPARKTFVRPPLKEAILARLAEDAARVAKLKMEVLALKAEGRKFYLYGLGWAFNLCAVQLGLGPEDVKGFADRNPATHRWRFWGRPARHPDCLSEAGPDDAVVIFTSIHLESMREQLRKTGFSGPVVEVS